jgi:hypothetical protein
MTILQKKLRKERVVAIVLLFKIADALLTIPFIIITYVLIKLF